MDKIYRIIKKPKTAIVADDETDRKVDEVLKRMLATPPQPKTSAAKN